jgi:site-specific DNA recombinase
MKAPLPGTFNKPNTGTAEVKRVGIWIRVSTEDQAKGESPEHHEKRARLYAEAKGWDVREVYHLEAMSGKSVMHLPETKRMLQDIASRRITGLIFSKLARLARNTRELLDFADIFRDQGADLISLQEAIDTSSPAGRLFYTLIAAMAQWEREEIADRVAASIPIRAKLGKHLGGQGPFGYRWDEGKLVVDPKEAPVRKLIYELFLEHRRVKTVARILNEEGYRTREGKQFCFSTVKRLLRDQTAKGVRVANYAKSLGDKRHWEYKPESEWVYCTTEPIVPSELWEQCNAMLDQRERDKKPRGRLPLQLFGSVTYCQCGHKMYVPSNSPKYTCQACRNKIPVSDLETIYHEELKHFLFSPEQIVQADSIIREKDDLFQHLQSEESRVTREMEKVYRLYIGDHISPEGFSMQYGPLEAQLKQLQDEIPSVQAEIDFLKIQHLSRNEILAEAKDLYDRWPMLTIEEKRYIVENITERITVGEKEVTIDFCYLPPTPPSSPSPELAAKSHCILRDWQPSRAGIPRESGRWSPRGRWIPCPPLSAREAPEGHRREIRRPRRGTILPYERGLSHPASSVGLRRSSLPGRLSDAELEKAASTAGTTHCREVPRANRAKLPVRRPLRSSPAAIR